MKPVFYDAHQHFHFEALTPHRAVVDAALREAGVRRAVVNGTSEEEWPVVSELASHYDWVLPSYGVHPWDAGNRSPHWLDALRARLLAEPHAAIGEIGLDRWIIDGVKPGDPRIAGLRIAPLAEQSEVLAAQLGLGAELNRAAAIHCVQAFGALLEVLQKSRLPASGFLLHGYTGPAEMLGPFTELGAYYSFNLQLLEPRHADRLENFRQIPADRLLVETDAPAKAPRPDQNRYPLGPGPDGDEINHPANLTFAYAALAEVRGVALSDLATQVEKNFARLFRV